MKLTRTNIKKMMIFGLILLIVLFFIKYNNDLIHVKFDENFHLVRDLPDKDDAAEVLSTIKDRLSKLIKYCIRNHPNDDRVFILKNRFNENNIQETDINDTGTSYSIDKGEEIHLCLRDKESQKLQKINTLMFVAIHELAHVMSVSYGHNEEFHKNFKFLLENAIKNGLYQNIDYSSNPEKFCGIEITSNPLF
jgi:hypothetical protein